MEKGVECRSLIPPLSCATAHLARYGMPTKDNLENHCFIDTDTLPPVTVVEELAQALGQHGMAQFSDNSMPMPSW